MQGGWRWLLLVCAVLKEEGWVRKEGFFFFLSHTKVCFYLLDPVDPWFPNLAEPVKSVLIMCVVSVPADTFLGIHSVLHAMALDPSVSYTVGSSISEFLGVKPMAVYPLGKLRANHPCSLPPWSSFCIALGKCLHLLMSKGGSFQTPLFFFTSEFN